MNAGETGEKVKAFCEDLFGHLKASEENKNCTDSFEENLEKSDSTDNNNKTQLDDNVNLASSI